MTQDESKAGLPAHWLVPEKPTVHKFTVKFPPVPSQTLQAIRAHVGQHSGVVKESTRVGHQLREWQLEEKAAQQKVLLAQKTLDQALAAKGKEMVELRRKKQTEIIKRLQDLERQMRQDQAREEEMAETAATERARKEFEKKYEEEQSRKRKRDQEENAANAPEDAKKDDNGDNPSDVKDATKTDDSTCCAVGGGRSLKQDDKKKSDKIPKPRSRELEEKRDQVQAEVDRLNERKTEMVWLLKQVIKAEGKQKALLAAQIKAEEANNSSATK